ncbi:MAG: biopolymer transporter ExbD [Bacteroidales bacterium]|nr:biopolymer transporter ExbD [Bacteroidales bacterium]
MARRDTPEIPSGAMADIAFMLLIFFLVATTMDVDSGLARMLPPKLDEEMPDPPEIKERNVFVVQINSQNRVALKGEPVEINQLKDKAKEFIANPNDLEKLPEKEIKDVEYFGPYNISKGVISLQNDNGTSYETYIAVQNELVKAYNELREDLAQSKFHKSFEELDEPRQSAIRKIYAQKISEAEPRNVGK